MTATLLVLPDRQPTRPPRRIPTLPPIFHNAEAVIRRDVFCTSLALALRKELMDRLKTRRSKLEWHASSTISPILRDDVE